MKKIHLIFAVALLGAVVLLGACKKETTGNPPSADFTVAGDTTGGTITMGTYDQYALTNASTNAVSWHWDFGNDSSSTLQNPILWYPQSGSYTLTLIVKNEDGATNKITRKVKVLDRYMKQVQITGFAPLMPLGHSLAHASLWAVIRLGQSGVGYPFPATDNQSFNAPIIYQSPVVSSADSTQLPYSFTIPGSILVNFAALMNFDNNSFTDSEPSNIGYGLELYAQDSTGVYLVSSSYFFYYVSGSGAIRWPVADIQRDIFVMQYANVQVNCDYE